MSLDIKDLESLFKLCRKQGVSEFIQDGLSIKFGDLPEKTSKKEGSYVSEDELPIDPYAGFTEELLSNDQLAFLANGGNPKEIPGIK